MKKTQTINLGKVIFTIDQDAYQKLDAYIHSLETHFSGKDDGGEIVADIEARIAEILNEKKVSIISIDDVVEIINIMGNSEQYDSEEDESENSSPKLNPSKEVVKRIYRHPSENIIAGVGAGLATRFNVDPLIVRTLLFLSIFLYGIGFFLYIFLWIMMPKVKSTSDLLRMRGLPINSASISKILKEEKVSNIKLIKKKSVIQILISVVKIILFPIIFIFGIFSCLVFLRVLLELEFHYYFFLLVLVAVFSTIIFLTLREIFTTKKRLSLKQKMLSISLLIISISTLVFFFPKHFYNNEKIIPLPEITSEDIHISMNVEDLNIYESFKEYGKENGKKTMTQTFSIRSPGIRRPELKINRANDQEIYLIIHDKGFSSSPIPSLLTSKPYNISPSKLTLEARDRTQLSYLKTEITILLPDNKSVYLDKSLKGILSNLNTVDNTDSDQAIGHKWKMTDKGLVKKPHPK